MNKLFLFLILIYGLSTSANAEIKRIVSGNQNAKITIIAYESLTCSHCANFHKDVYPSLKKDFIDTGLVKIEFRHFPLDIAALNASKISLCKQDQSLEILEAFKAAISKGKCRNSILASPVSMKSFLREG